MDETQIDMTPDELPIRAQDEEEDEEEENEEEQEGEEGEEDEEDEDDDEEPLRVKIRRACPPDRSSLSFALALISERAVSRKPAFSMSAMATSSRR